MRNPDRKRPFDRGFVLRATAKHMLESVEISIKKTMDRMPEFVGDPDKSHEVFLTLVTLHGLRKQVQELQQNNTPSE